MTLYSGKCITSAPAAVTGRLWQAGKNGERGDSARILLWDGLCELNEALLSSAVGVVCPHDIDRDKMSSVKRMAEFCHVPAIALDRTLCESASPDKIAILDTAQQKVYVNPDLETINRYFGAKRQKKSIDVSVLVTDDKSTAECDGLVTNESYIAGKDEEKIYELLCDTADKNTGARIVVKLPLCTEADFVSGVRAVYRASVWGVFSLLCTEIYTPTDASRCVSLIHAAFRKLDEEEREFNGFIPKGILIETPLMLLGRPSHRLLDHFCLDLGALTSRFCGGRDCPISEISGYIKSFIKNAGGAGIAVDIKNSAHISELEKLCRDGDIQDIYARRELVAKVRELF